MGALTQLYAGTMPDALNYNGEVNCSLFLTVFYGFVTLLRSLVEFDRHGIEVGLFAEPVSSEFLYRHWSEQK